MPNLTDYKLTCQADPSADYTDFTRTFKDGLDFGFWSFDFRTLSFVLCTLVLGLRPWVVGLPKIKVQRSKYKDQSTKNKAQRTKHKDLTTKSIAVNAVLLDLVPDNAFSRIK